MKINNFNYIADYNFDLTKFENRAEELENTNPGQGYKLAYKECLKDIARHLVERSKVEENVTSVLYAYKSFNEVMESYNRACKKENIDINIKDKFKNDTFKDDLNYYNFMKEAVVSFASPMGSIYDKYK